MKIGIAGIGKRFLSTYFDVLKNFNCEIIVWNRTKSKSKKFSVENNCKFIEDIKEFEELDLDLCLCFLPDDVNYDVMGNIKLDCPLLIETPVTDHRWVNKKDVGVLEQWIYLPIEQFKQEVYHNKVVSKPYWIYNDGRSYDYHAIAQLRNYVNNELPLSFKGIMQNEHNEGFVDKTGKINTTSHFWTHGQVQLSSGTVLSHSFSYNCKMTNLKPIQLIRCYSSDGAIVSGRMNEMDNDYEMLDVRYLNKARQVVVGEIHYERKDNVTNEISLREKNIIWKNKFKGLDDQKTAMCYLIDNALKNKIYDTKNGYIDFITIQAIKQSAVKNQTVSLN